MTTAKCATCGYSLEGLKPISRGRVVCPECSHDQAPAETGKRWGGTRACLVTSLAVHVPLWAGLLAAALTLREKNNTLVPLSLFAPAVVGTIAGGVAGYRAAGRKNPAALGSSVEHVWWPVVSLLFNGLLWIATMAVTFLIMLSLSSGSWW